jgi:hypothetical protein
VSRLVRRRLARGRLFSLALLAALWACGREGTLEIRIITPPGQDPFAGAVMARLTIGTIPPVSRDFPISGGKVEGEIRPAPTEVVAPLTVELLDARGGVLARGRTPEVPLSPLLTGYVEILVARVGAFARVPGAMTIATRLQAATVITRFEVLVMGGLDRAGAPVARAEVYNLFGHAFESAGSLATPRARAVVLPQADGRFWIFGGQVAGPEGRLTPTATAEVVNVQTGTITSSQGAGEPRAAPATALFPDSSGRWLVAGGEGVNGPLASALSFDSATGTLTTLAASMQAPRSGHSATPVQTALGPRILIYGGAESGPEAELFDPSSGTFAPLAAPDRRWEHSATLLPDGLVLLAGGRSPNGEPRHDLLLYDGSCRDAGCATFTVLDLSLLEGRSGHSAHALSGNRILLSGGRGAAGEPLATSEILLYDPAARRLSREASPPQAFARAEFSAVELPTGQILFVGGVDASGVPLQSAEIFNPQ